MAPEKTDPPPQLPEADPRSTLRLHCDRAVQVWTPGHATPMWGQLHDLSVSGCYIALRTPVPEGTPLHLLMLLYGTKVRTDAAVCRVEPNQGMGVKFNNMPPADLGALRRALASMHPEQVQPELSVDPGLVLDLLDTWFKHHPTLSAEEYARLRFVSAKLQGGSVNTGTAK